MAVRQFKELDRKDINQPDDMVDVTVVPKDGMTTKEGFKEQGETFQMPAHMARVHQQAGMVNIGGGGAENMAAVRVEAYEQHHNVRKQVAKKVKEAREGAIKEVVGISPEQGSGQAGLAEADSGDPRMFSGSQSEYEAKLVAQRNQALLNPEFSPTGSPNNTSAVAATDEPEDTQPQPSSEENRESESEAKSGDSYDDNRKEELVEIAQARGIATNGKNKGQLVEALRESDRSAE